MKSKDAKTYKLNTLTLTMTGVGTIIGSGWLFGSAHAAQMAGPAAIFSWIIGAVMVLVISLNLIEVITITPNRMGGIGYYLRYTHGSFAAFLAEWTILIGFISSIPSEATASTQYLSDWNFTWAHTLYDKSSQTLTVSGLIISSVLCIVYFLINYYSLSFLSKSIKTITFTKIAVPIIAVISFIAVGYTPSNLHYVGNHTIAPYGISGVLSAVTMAGIIFAFNGFQAPISFAAETRNPKKSIPAAVIYAVIITTILYVALQFAYIVSMPQNLLRAHGWNGLNFSSPFAELAIALNINLVAIVLFADAFISPSGSGIIYTSLSGRVIQGMHNHLPKVLGTIDKRTKLPRIALIFSLIMSFLALWVLPSWDKLAAVISVGYVLCYTTVPVCTWSFRKLLRHDHLSDKAIRIPGMWLFSPLAFILATFMLYWSRWPLNGEVIFIVLIAIPIYLYYATKQRENIRRESCKIVWLISYLIFVAIYGYIGNKDFNGIGLIPSNYGLDHIILAVLSLLFFFWGVKTSYKTDAYIEHIERNQQDQFPDNSFF